MSKRIIQLIILLFAVFISCDIVLAAGSSPDAIAIRVIPNPNHYSAMRWYKEQGFANQAGSSPQSLLIDGYEAIRDGRTVYVNAANVDTASSKLYTNIYLISYNQDAEQATIDILSRILEHWKFNENISGAGNCVKPDKSLGDVCLRDIDCTGSQYCSGKKAEITRDTRRLADLAEIKIALSDYQEKNNKYPALSSGSYLPNKTISTWPSWQETLARELKSGLANDPINKLGDCAGFDQTTCWNELTKKFADPKPAPANPELNLPACSHVYVYTAKNNGASYDLCAVMESGLLTTLDQGACAESAKTVQFAGTLENHPPVFAGENLPLAESGRPYQGFVKASDPDNDQLNWQLTIISCPLWNKLRLENTPIAGQKAIKADHAGQAVDCVIKIVVSDKREAGQISKDFTINVINGNVPIIEPIADKIVTIGKNLAFTIKASEADNQYPLSFSFTGAPAGFNSTGVLDANKHDLNVSGAVVDITKEYNVIVTASDLYLGESAPANFKIKVVNQPPAFTSTAPVNATACVNYSYAAQAGDPDGHTVSYFDPANSLPAGLTINQNSGAISGQPQNTGDFYITIEARDQYYSQTDPQSNAKTSQSWDLHIVLENFTVTPPAEDDVWVFANGGAGLYYNQFTGYPTQYKATASVSTSNHVVYGLSDAAHLIPAASLAITPDFVIIVDADGNIQGTPTNNAGDLGSHIVTVTATNDCGAAKSANLTINVKKNEWCGDGTCHSAALSTENCATCVADCACGGSDVCFSGSCCLPATCAGNSNWCGTHDDGCGTTIDCGSGWADTNCSGGGLVSCVANRSACDGNRRDANGCEINTLTNNNNCGSCGNVCGANHTCTGGVCVCNAAIRYTIKFPNGTTLNTNSLSVNFTFASIGQENPSITINGQAFSQGSFDKTLVVDNNSVNIFANAGDCDQCNFACEGVYAKSTIQEGSSYIFTDSSNQQNGHTTENQGDGYVDTVMCGNCCYTQFLTTISVTDNCQ